MTRAVAADPMPVSGTATDPPLVPVAVSVALFTPAPDGVKVTSTVVDAPPASVAAAGAPAEN